MGFHIDMAELIKLKDAYEKDSTATVESLDLAKTGMNGIITSNAMYGEVGKAINDEINNSHNAIIVGLKDSYEVTSGEFSQTLAGLQEAIGESSETAVLNEDAMSKAGENIDSAGASHEELEGAISGIYGNIKDIISLSSPKSSVKNDLSKAKQVLTDAIEKVNTFDGEGQEAQATSLLAGLNTWIEMGNQVQGLSYTDPVFTEFAAYSVLADAVQEIDSELEKVKKDFEEDQKKRLKEAKDKEKKVQEDWEKHHPLQAMIKSVQEDLGDWWEGVKNGTKKDWPPVFRETGLFVEGFLGSLVGLVGDVVYMGVDFLQIAHEEVLLGISGISSVISNTTGTKPYYTAPQWIMDDYTGMVATEYSMLEYVGKLFYDGETQKHARQSLGQAWDDFIADPYYNLGALTPDIIGLFLGYGEVKAGLTAAKGSTSFAKGVSAFGKAAGKAALKNADDMARGIGRLITRGDDLTRKAGRSLKRNFAKFGSEVKDELVEKTARLKTLKEGTEEALKNIQIPKGNRMQLAFETATNLADDVTSVSDLFGDTKQLMTSFKSDVGEAVGRYWDDLSSTAKVTGSVGDIPELPSWIDDLGNVIRDGSHMDGKLPKPNVIYEAGEHQYLYRTDGFGRIERAYAEDLQLKVHDGRLRHNSATLDKEVGDHAGHIFGDLFGGSPELDNLVSQAKDVNLKEYRRIERDWADALKSEPPKKVEVNIKINYDGNSMRPSDFEVNYKIDGVSRSEVIPNVNIN